MKEEHMMTYAERREHMLKTDPEFASWVEEMEREGEAQAYRNVREESGRAMVIAACMTLILLLLAVTFSLIMTGGK